MHRGEWPGHTPGIPNCSGNHPCPPYMSPTTARTGMGRAPALPGRSPSRWEYLTQRLSLSSRGLPVRWHPLAGLHQAVCLHWLPGGLQCEAQAPRPPPGEQPPSRLPGEPQHAVGWPFCHGKLTLVLFASLHTRLWQPQAGKHPRSKRSPWALI